MASESQDPARKDPQVKKASGTQASGGDAATGRDDSARRFPDLRMRVVSATLAAVVGLALVWAGGIWTTILIAAVAGAMMWEYRSVTLHGGGRCGDDVTFLLGTVGGAAVLAGLSSWWAGATWLVWGLIGSALADFLSGRRKAMGWGVAGAAYIGAAAISFLYLRGLEPHGLLTVIWIVVVVAAADIGGYFGGRLVGGPKLWPRVSPKKTWAGIAGGLLLAAVTGAAFSLASPEAGAGWVALVSAGAALVSQAGDLVESALKRHFGVKDAGRLLPGHGGAMDRFDGLAPAALAAAVASALAGGSVVIG